MRLTGSLSKTQDLLLQCSHHGAKITTPPIFSAAKITFPLKAGIDQKGSSSGQGGSSAVKGLTQAPGSHHTGKRWGPGCSLHPRAVALSWLRPLPED